MTFKDIKKDKYAKEMLGLTINRIRYINPVQLPDDIMKDFFHLMDVGGFVIEIKEKNHEYKQTAETIIENMNKISPEIMNTKFK